jgi:hypothetical protein
MSRRIVFAFLLLLAARAAFAQSVLLPVGGIAGDESRLERCRGLRVYDLGSRSLIRNFAQLGCVETVVSAGAGRAFLVLRRDATHAELQHFDIDSGRTLARVDLGAIVAEDRFTLRLVRDREVLVSIRSRDDPATRFARLGLDGGALHLRAQAQASGRAASANLGDELAAWEWTPGGIAIERLRVEDLAPLGRLTLAREGHEWIYGVLAFGGRLYVSTSDTELWVKVFDPVTGALLARTPRDFGFNDQFAFVDASRFLTLRARATQVVDGKTQYRTELIAVSLPGMSAVTLATRTGPSIVYGPLDAHGVAPESNWICVEVPSCGSTPPLKLFFANGASFDSLVDDAVTTAPNSLQFVGPALATETGAAPVPALDLAGGMMLGLALTWLGARRPDRG